MGSNKLAGIDRELYGYAHGDAVRAELVGGRLRGAPAESVPMEEGVPKGCTLQASCMQHGRTPCM